MATNRTTTLTVQGNEINLKRTKLADYINLTDIARSRETALASGHGTHDAWRRANLARVGALIARAALWREESRGGHRRTDFPERDDLNWKIHGSAKLEVLSAK